MSTSAQSCNKMQIYKLIVTTGNTKVDYGYHSQLALNTKLTTLLAEYNNASVITITQATVQLDLADKPETAEYDQIRSAIQRLLVGSF